MSERATSQLEKVDRGARTATSARGSSTQLQPDWFYKDGGEMERNEREKVGGETG